MEDLRALVGELAARVDELQARNAVLERAVGMFSHHPTTATARADATAGPSSDHGEVSRRRLLGRAVGVAAVGAAALTLADAGSAAAATGGNFVLGNGNTADNTTGLSCTDNTKSGLWVIAGQTSDLTYTAAVMGDSSTQNGVAGLTSADGVGCYGVSHARSGLGYFPAAVFGDSDTHPGVYGESASSYGVRGVSGLSTGTSSLQSGVWGDSFAYPGVVGTSHQSFGLYGSSIAGAGVAAIGGSVGLTANAPTAVSATSSSSSGHAVVASATSSKASASVSNGGSGVGLQVSAKTGRGATLKGGAAQLQLIPGSRTSHPTSGARGDLYADSSGRLWFCKVSGSHATWHQIA